MIGPLITANLLLPAFSACFLVSLYSTPIDNQNPITELPASLLTVPVGAPSVGISRHGGQLEDDFTTWWGK